MKHFKIKYKVSFESQSRQGGRNRFEVDYTVKTLLRVAVLQLLESDISFARLFKDGNYDITTELEEFDEDKENKKLKEQLHKSPKSKNSQNPKK